MLVGVRQSHPLLGAFPLAVMSLAVVLIAFAFAMASVSHGSDSNLPSPPGLGALRAVTNQAR